MTGLKPISSDLAGKYTFVVYGFVNLFGQLAGIVSSRVMGAVLEGKNQGNPKSWELVFYIPGTDSRIYFLKVFIFSNNFFCNNRSVYYIWHSRAAGVGSL